ASFVLAHIFDVNAKRLAAMLDHHRVRTHTATHTLSLGKLRGVIIDAVECRPAEFRQPNRGVERMPGRRLRRRLTNFIFGEAGTLRQKKHASRQQTPDGEIDTSRPLPAEVLHPCTLVTILLAIEETGAATIMFLPASADPKGNVLRLRILVSRP